MEIEQSCWWRFKGDKEWKYGWPSIIPGGLVRMGTYAGDTVHGQVIKSSEVEIKQRG